MTALGLSEALLANPLQAALASGVTVSIAAALALSGAMFRVVILGLYLRWWGQFFGICV